MLALKVVLHSANNIDTYKNITIDEGKHEQSLKSAVEGKKGNPVLEGLGSINKLYDLQNFGQGPRNIRAHNPTAMNEQSNLGTNHKSKMASLGRKCAPQHWSAFDRLIKQYRDVSTRVDDDLSAYNAQITQHGIPGKGGAKPLQQNSGKTHMSFELLMQK